MNTSTFIPGTKITYEEVQQLDASLKELAELLALRKPDQYDEWVDVVTKHRSEVLAITTDIFRTRYAK